VSERLAYAKDCVCGSPIFMAICRDGRWRPFETREQAAGTPGTWAWRKTYGMEETELARGRSIHYCAVFHDRIDTAAVVAELHHPDEQRKAS
jgi:hypothetical protein